MKARVLLRTRRRRCVIAAALSALAAGGCGGRGDVAADAPGAVVRWAESGPVELAVRVNSTELDLGTMAEIRVEVTAERGVTVDVGDLREAVADDEDRFEYQVERSAERVARPLADGKLAWTYDYRVTFFLPGEYALPPARVRFLADAGRESADADGWGAAEGEWEELATEPVTLTVRDPRAAALTPEELKEVSTLDPVALPAPWARWWWAGLLALILLGAAAWGAWRRMCRKQAGDETVVPADVWARQQITALLAEDLVSRGLVQTFYYRLSDIVRGYIERRFSISAPEMTTEEFLAATAADERFDGRHTEQLDRFLGACDLVKYARHEPWAGEINGMLKEAWRFIEDTRTRVSADGGANVQSQDVQDRAA